MLEKRYVYHSDLYFVYKTIKTIPGISKGLTRQQDKNSKLSLSQGNSRVYTSIGGDGSGCSVLWMSPYSAPRAAYL